MPRAAGIAETGVIIYDAIFISLAEAMDSVVATADDRLIGALRGTPHETRARHLAEVDAILTR